MFVDGESYRGSSAAAKPRLRQTPEQQQTGGIVPTETLSGAIGRQVLFASETQLRANVDALYTKYDALIQAILHDVALETDGPVVAASVEVLPRSASSELLAA